MASIGIDIGTSYSSVCILDRNNQPERVKVSTGTSMFGDAHSLPSAAFVESDGRLLLGQAAMANRMRIPENFKSEFKRDLGQPAPYLLGNRQFMPEDLYKEFFIYLKKCVEEYTRESVTEATITCPAVYNRNKIELVRNAAKKAGLLQVTILDEPSAAAYCYLNAGKLKDGDVLLVYDLGGGTFDVALLRYTGGDFKQLEQPQGIATCGGADFDELIFEHILEQIGEERLAPIRANALFYRRFVTQIMEIAIKAKHHLSSAELFTDVIPVGYDAVDYVLTRDAYNTMIASIVDETIHQVRMILRNAGMKTDDVSNVLLVGGASRTPMVRERVARLMGKEPLKDIDPELAVCAGAAVHVLARAKAEEEHRREEARKEELGRRILEEEQTEYTLAAIQGDADAQFNLAYHYKENSNYKKAVEWYIRSAVQGNSGAQNNLGGCFYSGHGVAQNYEKAFEWYAKAAEQGVSIAQNNLGHCYYHGRGVPQNYEKAVEWYTKAAEQGYASAQRILGDCYENGNGVTRDYGKAVEWYRKAAVQGYAEAQYNLGECYKNGFGVTENYPKAVEWCTKAAEQGYANAQYALGHYYMLGYGVPQNIGTGVEWYTKAAVQGFEEAQNVLGDCYYEGVGTAQDYSKAVEWYIKAAGQGNAEAQFSLAVCCENGTGMPQNIGVAVGLYTRAAELGNAEAQLNLALCLKSGTGVPQDYPKAVEWYTKAAEQGNATAQNNLGYCYLNGEGVPQNYGKAVEWFSKAADQESARAQHNLGICYYNGHGVARDYNMAGILWDKAAKQGFQAAINDLKDLELDSNNKYVKVGLMKRLFS